MVQPVSSTSTKSGKPRLSAEDWILAGHELLVDEGIAGIKIDRLAARLGVTKGSFYWHFTNLPAFLAAMAERFIARQREEMAGFEATAPSDPRERLLWLMNRISDPEIGALEQAMRGWAYEEADLHLSVERVDRWGFGVVREAFERLGFVGHDAEVRAKALYYAGIGRLHTGILGEPEGLEHREHLLDVLTRRG
jgi:AcrR family transcriptional regulator